MITRIAICRRAAVPVAESSRVEEMARRLRERITERGRALFASDEDREEFLHSLKDVEHKAWIELIIGKGLVGVFDGNVTRRIDLHEQLDDLRRSYAAVADVVVCSEGHARKLGVTFDPPVASRPEVAGLVDVDRVSAFGYDETSRWTRRRVDAGEDREEIFRERIAPFVADVREIVIYDRYALTSVVRGESGLDWLLRRVQEVRMSHMPLKLEISTGISSRVRARRDVTTLRQTIERLGLLRPDATVFDSVKVWLANDELARRDMHDRFFSFDGRSIVSGNGLALFAAPIVTAGVDLSVANHHECEETAGRLTRSSGCEGARWRRERRMWVTADGRSLPPAETESFDDGG